MAMNGSLREPAAQIGHEAAQSAALSRGASVLGRMSIGRNTAYITYTYRVSVMAITVSADAIQRTSGSDGAVQFNYEMITDIVPAVTAHMSVADLRDGDRLPLRSSRTMNDDFIYLSHDTSCHIYIYNQYP